MPDGGPLTLMLVGVHLSVCACGAGAGETSPLLVAVPVVLLEVVAGDALILLLLVAKLGVPHGNNDRARLPVLQVNHD